MHSTETRHLQIILRHNGKKKVFPPRVTAKRRWRLFNVFSITHFSHSGTRGRSLPWRTSCQHQPRIQDEVMRRILWEEWRNADYTFTMTSKEPDLVCWWKRNHKSFPALQKHLPKWKVRETEWETDSTDLRSKLEGTHAQQLSLNCGGLRGLQCCIYCLLMLGISNIKSSFFSFLNFVQPMKSYGMAKNNSFGFPSWGQGP